MSEIYKSQAAKETVEAGYRAILDAWPVAKEELRIATSQGETFVVACGPKDAPPLLAFHGAQANAATWMFDSALWSQSFRVYSVDVPGDAGFSAPVRPPLGSEAYVTWLDEVMAALGVDRARLVGVSLGGWLALDYATRRPERIERLAVLCPAGVGAQKNLLLKALPLLFLGKWGQKKLHQMVFGSSFGDVPPAAQGFVAFMTLVATSTRPRPLKIPAFCDAALARLTMPVLAIVGGKDVLLDSEGTRRRLAAHVPRAEVRYLPEGRHVLPGQAEAIYDFLRGAS
ncbi:alpha/beta fold hydrolase [Phenylobacterium sp.]|uniref:alpha/beta fold hydrolase n=1 Tax=Phenylobacterium sp. TaxID=1871053 RepID=UPI00273265F0|nr:alpha/beta hydrolase [Phenylobacterium sp.]MDP3853941.1 alpha/beta hydrolase [Phenylobacterium sp.]